jgi:hypothetical protein
MELTDNSPMPFGVYKGKVKAKNINHFKPASHDHILREYKGLREPDAERDEFCSPLHDSIMGAISSNLREYAPSAYDAAWTTTLFPERLTKEVLRLCEEQMAVSFPDKELQVQ